MCRPASPKRRARVASLLCATNVPWGPRRSPLIGLSAAFYLFPALVDLVRRNPRGLVWVAQAVVCFWSRHFGFIPSFGVRAIITCFWDHNNNPEHQVSRVVCHTHACTSQVRLRDVGPVVAEPRHRQSRGIRAHGVPHRDRVGAPRRALRHCPCDADLLVLRPEHGRAPARRLC
mmetsp:Transcript_13483/g.54089  ORF Transcript_13483/g.54089 Transcript_13483/m.54089 type:complete len:174 (-) Transcript_13483:293-814(-)